SSGVAWRPAPEPAPAYRGGTLVAETGELAAVSMSAAARVGTRTGSHIGVGQPATGPFPSLTTGSHPTLAEPTHPTLADGSSTSLTSASGSQPGSVAGWQPSSASGSQSHPNRSRALPIILAGVVLLLVIAGVGALWSSSGDDDQPAKAAKSPSSAE